MTCAHIAAAKGSVAVIRELMKFNKSVVTTARNRVLRPLHRAVVNLLDLIKSLSNICD